MRPQGLSAAASRRLRHPNARATSGTQAIAQRKVRSSCQHIIFGPDNADLRDLNCMQKAMARSGGIHLAKLMVAKAPTGQSRLRELEPSHPPLDASAPT